jgi:hypothetical protein
MIVEQIRIPESLKGCVQSLWKLGNCTNNISQKELTTFADGCPGFIFQHTDKGVFYQNQKQLPPAFLYGQTTTHNIISVAGEFSTIGIFFYPNALKTVFGLQAADLTDSCIDMALLPATQSFSLLDKLLNSKSTDEQINTITAFVSGQINKNSHWSDAQMHYAIFKITSSKGSISLKQIIKDLNVSERKFERCFKECVGITPKLC